MAASGEVDSPDPGLTSLTLLQRVQARDQQAWGRLVHIYGPLVYHWCRVRHLADADAADVLQEVFQAVAVQVGGFRRDRSGASFRGWLWGITRHKIADHFRRLQQQPQAAGGSAALEQQLLLPERLPPEEEEPAAGLIAHRVLDLVRGDFEERTWQAFWRSAVEGQLPRDIAVDLGRRSP